jgi:hypothetical protein
MSKKKQNQQTNRLRHYVATYTITKVELVSDIFTTGSVAEIRKQLKDLVKTYNSYDKASQIVDLSIVAVEET